MLSVRQQWGGVLVLVSAHNLSFGGGLSTAVSLLGPLLLCVAAGQWPKRPKPGAEPTAADIAADRR
jgi:hypothetical protein